MMRTGKCRQQAILGKQFERAQVQLPIAAKRVAETALRSGKRWRIENDQIVFGFASLRAAQETENILLDPAHLESVSLSILFSGRNIFGIFFDCPHVGGAGPSARQRERALIREAVQNAASRSEAGDN